jgi:hypothetical protein
MIPAIELDEDEKSFTNSPNIIEIDEEVARELKVCHLIEIICLNINLC